LPIDTGSGGICSGCALILLVELRIRRGVGHCDGVVTIRMCSVCALVCVE
jgi:hypothetical protein